MASEYKWAVEAVRRAKYDRMVGERADLFGQLCEAKRRKDSRAARALNARIDDLTRRMGEFC